jgi:hypothetical protein
MIRPRSRPGLIRDALALALLAFATYAGLVLALAL